VGSHNSVLDRLMLRQFNVGFFAACHRLHTDIAIAVVRATLVVHRGPPRNC
jgi:hypothetical protein